MVTEPHTFCSSGGGGLSQIIDIDDFPTAPYDAFGRAPLTIAEQLIIEALWASRGTLDGLDYSVLVQAMIWGKTPDDSEVVKQICRVLGPKMSPEIRVLIALKGWA